MRTNLEKKTIIFVYGFIFIIIVICGSIIYPTIKHIRDINTDTSSLRQYLENKYRNALNIRGSKRQVDEVKEDIESFTPALFQSSDVLQLITFLEDTAAKNKVEQRIVSSDLDKFNEKIHINLAISGQYYNILRYVSDIEQNKHYINEKNIQISAGASAQNNLADYANMNLDLVLYVNK